MSCCSHQHVGELSELHSHQNSVQQNSFRTSWTRRFWRRSRQICGQHHRHHDTTTAGNRQMIYLSASTMVVLQWRRMTLCSHDPHQVSPSVSCSCFLLIILFVGCWTSGDLMAEASGSDGSSLCPLRRSCWGLWPPDSTSGQIKLLLINEAAGRRRQHRGAEDNRTTVLHSESSLMSC